MKMKNKLHKFFLNNPKLGFIGYEIIRNLKRIKGANKGYSNLKRLGFDPQVIYDVGANRAEWSRNVKTIFNNADFFLFEPQKEMEPFLAKFSDDFSGSKYFLTALGPEVGTAEIEIWDDFAGTTLLHKETEKPTRTIPVNTIDNIIHEGTPRPNLLKIDVQSYELNVLRGASECFGYTEVIILEVALYSLNPNQPVFSDIVLFMAENGYIVYDLWSLHRNVSTNILRYLDVVFVEKNSSLKFK